MKIAMIGSRGIGNNYGGIEKSLTEICPRLTARGHEVTVFSLMNGNQESYFYKGVKIIPVKGINGKHAQTFTRSALSTFNCLGKGFDVINFHAEGPGAFSIFAKMFSLKSVVTVHGLDWNREKWSKMARFSLKTAEKIAVKFADRMVVVSRNLQQYFKAVHGIKSHYIPNGMSKGNNFGGAEKIKQLGIVPNNYVFFANRLEPGKGCQDLIRAFNKIDTKKKLVIAGDTSSRSLFVQELKRTADPDKIIFTGHVSGDLLEQLYRNAYLFILPSYSEGLSNALLEAIAHHKFPLVSNIPGNLEVVGGNEFAFKVGCVSDLRQKLTTLLNNEKIVQNGQVRLFEEAQKKYNWDDVAIQYEKLYLSFYSNTDFE